MSTETVSSAMEHDRIVDAVWDAFSAEPGPRLVGVESPPGAGKSTLVRTIARRWAEAERFQMPIVTQTNAQADDLCADLAVDLDGTSLTVGRLHGGSYAPDPRLVAAGVACASSAGMLASCNVVIAPARKWAHVRDSTWPAAIIDEAFQMRSDDLLSIGHNFERLLVVGDPGQLDPFTSGNELLVRGADLSPLQTAADTLRATQPDAQWFNLPLSWRLPPSAAQVISESFYVNPFRSGVADGVRKFRMLPRDAGQLGNRALSHAASAGWAFVELPEAHLPITDPEAVATIVDLVVAALEPGITVSDENGGPRSLTPDDIVVAVTHTAQRGHVRMALDRRLAAIGMPAGSVTVDTANRIQGRQFELVIVWHPLSGRRDASEFHLDAGRLCVMLSRHRHACLVVSRGGIRAQLEAHPGVGPVWIGETPTSIDGHEAHLTLLDHLEQHRIEV